MDKTIRMAVIGAGLAGQQHVAAIKQCEGVELIALVDPDHKAKTYAEKHGVPCYPRLNDLLTKLQPDGVILATPNQLHVENGFECLANKCPMLIEKPLATSAEEAQELVEAAKKAKVPLLVGHHRRHNPLIQKAHALIQAGKLGQLRAVHANCWLYKPDDYFENAPWRKLKGAGPIAVNLVHDIDLIRYLCGDIVSVQAQAAPSIRGFENEDLASALLTFENGVIGTITVSDTIVSPWSWELTAGENPAYAPTSQSCYLLGGTHGSLSLPDLTFWDNQGDRGWWQPIRATTEPRDKSLALVNQVDQFARVIRGEEPPLVPGEEGLKTLRVIEAIQRAAQNGSTVALS